MTLMIPMIPALLAGLAGCRADCEAGYARANDGNCYPLSTGDDDDDDDDRGGRGDDDDDDDDDRTVDAQTGTVTDPYAATFVEFADARCSDTFLVLTGVVVGRHEELVFDVVADDDHEFHNLAVDARGAGEVTELELELPGGGWTSAESTGFTCPDALSSAQVTVALRAYDDERLVACATFGGDEERLPEVVDGDTFQPDDLADCF